MGVTVRPVCSVGTHVVAVEGGVLLALLKDELLSEDQAPFLLDPVSEPGPDASALVKSDGTENDDDERDVGPDRRLGDV